jgi:molecular chaperone DnaK (HSP70)
MTEWVLGVDIGSGWAAGAAGAGGGRPEVLVVGGDRSVPCTVVLTEDGRLLAGAFAHRAARRLPDRAERDPRRYAGRSPMLLGGTPVAAGDALAALLALFVAEGRRRHDGRDPARVALTHPAGWAADRLAVLRTAAERVVSGTDVLLVPEPVAAAAHDAAGGARAPGPLAVLDLGATSLDVAVVVPGRGPAAVGGVGPRPRRRAVRPARAARAGRAAGPRRPEWWREVSTNPDRAWLAAAADLAEEARLAREALTDLDVTARYVPGADVDVRLTRDELEALLDDEVGRGVRLLDRTLEGAGGPQPRAVLVTGGTGVTPLVLARLRECFGERVRLADDPQGAAALGAARLAATPATPAPAVSGRAVSDPAVPTPAVPRPAGPARPVLPPAVVDARVGGRRAALHLVGAHRGGAPAGAARPRHRPGRAGGRAGAAGRLGRGPGRAAGVRAPHGR